MNRTHIREKGALAILVTMMMLLASFASPLLPVAGAASVGAANGCGYGSGGPSAETICWLDMSNFDETTAQTANGQQMSVTLPGGYTASFTVKLAAGTEGGPRPMEASALPTWSGSVLGNAYYKNTPGKPALWTSVAADGVRWDGWTDHVALSDFTVKDASGANVTSYSLIVADAESTDGSGGGKNVEALQFGSDKPLNMLFTVQPATWNPACAGGLSGVGTTSVMCSGKQGDKDNRAGAAVLYAQSPKTISADIKVNANSREAVAFGMQFSSVKMTKNIVSRYDASDQFTVDTENTDGTTIASSTSSGTESSTSTDVSTLVSPVDGQEITFRESAAAGTQTDLTHYTAKWNCDKNGVAMPETDYHVAKDGRSATAKVGTGEFVSCAVSNTAKLGSATWEKIGDNNSGLLAGSQWSLTGPDGYSKTIVDNGSNDSNTASGKLTAAGLKWGTYTLIETKAPAGHLIDKTPHTFTVTDNDLTLDLGDIVNTTVKPGLKVVKTSDPASGSTVKPGQTVTYKITATNTGNVVLDPARVTDDLSGVFDNATYVNGSATATSGDTPSVDVNGKTLSWAGKIEPGKAVTLTYQVKVNQKVADDAKLANLVVASGDVPDNPPVPSNCTTDTANTDPDCHTTHDVVNPPNGPTVHTGGTVEKPDDTGYLMAGGLVVLGLLGTGAGLTILLKKRSAERR